MKETTEAGADLAAEVPQGASLPARPDLRSILLRLSLVALLVAADLASKSTIMPWLEQRMPQFGEVYDPGALPALERDHHGHLRHELLGGHVTLMHNLNYGAAFGQLDSAQWFLVVGRAVAAVVLLVWVTRSRELVGAQLLALLLVLAGCLGNLWDNLTYEPLRPLEGRPFGPVRDFIDVYFGIWDWHFPTFNIADSAITIGAILLLLAGQRGSSSEDVPLEPEA